MRRITCLMCIPNGQAVMIPDGGDALERPSAGPLGPWHSNAGARLCTRAGRYGGWHRRRKHGCCPDYGIFSEGEACDELKRGRSPSDSEGLEVSEKIYTPPPNAAEGGRGGSITHPAHASTLRYPNFLQSSLEVPYYAPTRRPLWTSSPQRYLSCPHHDSREPGRYWEGSHDGRRSRCAGPPLPQWHER